MRARAGSVRLKVAADHDHFGHMSDAEHSEMASDIRWEPVLPVLSPCCTRVSLQQAFRQGRRGHASGSDSAGPLPVIQDHGGRAADPPGAGRPHNMDYSPTRWP